MNITVAEISCCNCGVSFWITTAHNKELISCHNSFYCPNGHRQSYVGETDKQKLEKLRSELRLIENDREMTARTNAALRGVITKMKNKEDPNVEPSRK